MFRSFVCIAGVLLCASLALAQDPGRQWGPNGVGCNFLGNGGQIVLYPPGDLNKWIKLQFFKLQEVDVNGTVVAQADDFGFFGFEWVTIGNTTVFGAKALQFTISEPFLHIRTLNYNPTWNPNHTQIANQNNDFTVNFQVSSFLFLQNFTAEFAGENIIGKEGQVKWQLDISGWKFQNAANKLQYGIQLFSSQVANNTGYKRLDHVPGTFSSFAIGFGVGNIVVPTVAIEDGVNVNIGTNVTYSGGQLAITWDFPSFTYNLTYDPITATSDLVVDDATSTTTSGVVSDKSVSALAVIAAMVITMWTMKRQD